MERRHIVNNNRTHDQIVHVIDTRSLRTFPENVNSVIWRWKHNRPSGVAHENVSVSVQLGTIKRILLVVSCWDVLGFATQNKEGGLMSMDGTATNLVSWHGVEVGQTTK